MLVLTFIFPLLVLLALLKLSLAVSALALEQLIHGS
jgi:hypothetical protein